MHKQCDTYWKVRKMTKLLRLWVPYNYCYFYSFFFPETYQYKQCKCFFLQNLPTLALFFFFFFLQNWKLIGTVDKFLKKKKLNKSNNDYGRPIIQAFFVIFLTFQYASHYLCVHLSLLFLYYCVNCSMFLNPITTLFFLWRRKTYNYFDITRYNSECELLHQYFILYDKAKLMQKKKRLILYVVVINVKYFTLSIN